HLPFVRAVGVQDPQVAILVLRAQPSVRRHQTRCLASALDLLGRTTGDAAARPATRALSTTATLTAARSAARESSSSARRRISGLDSLHRDQIEAIGLPAGRVREALAVSRPGGVDGTAD